MAQSELQNLIDAFPAAVIYVSQNQRVLAANGPAEELFGPGLVGRHYITAMRNPTLLQAIEKVLGGSETQHARAHISDYGRERALEVMVAAANLSLGQGALVHVTDVTRLEEADQQRRDFVANLGHELKTPLTAMLGLMETLRGPARADPEARERFLSFLETEALRMNRLVGDLLALSRVESREYDPPDREVDLIELIHSVVATLEPLASAQSMQIMLMLGRYQEEELSVRGDEGELRQLLSNLVENALKYGSGPGNRVLVILDEIKREPALRQPAIQIDVRDEGPGIDPVHIPRLTERFYRVDTHRSREKGGTGLGLAIVKHIVNRHRGRMRILSSLGEGATFRVILPLEANHQESSA